MLFSGRLDGPMLLPEKSLLSVTEVKKRMAVKTELLVAGLPLTPPPPPPLQAYQTKNSGSVLCEPTSNGLFNALSRLNAPKTNAVFILTGAASPFCRLVLCQFIGSLV